MAQAFSLTEKAAVEIINIQQREGKENYYLRVAVQGGGCSGLSYKLSFEQEKKEKDLLFDAGIKIIIDQKSMIFLKGTTIDFTDGLTGQGFVFVNPNSKTTCGCGNSFSA